MISIEIVGSEELAQRILSVPDKLHMSAIRKVTALTLLLEAHVKQDKLSGQVLKVQSGALRRSIKSSVTVDGNVITGRVFSDGSVPYADIQEFGGTTSPHDILPVKAQALRFLYEGKYVFAKVVHHPGSVIPQRSYLRSALSDMAGLIEREMTKTIEEADL